MDESIMTAIQHGRAARLRSGRVLRNLRVSRGLSQEAIAQALGVTQGTLSRMEREGIGRTDNLFAVAAAFNVDPADILAGAVSEQIVL
jgi:transcriptional regulator with XRE-family HTH domain